MSFNKAFKIGNSMVGDGFPTYFIADIAANHDGSLDRALQLIQLASQAGANAVKFQHFSAETIVSDEGFKALGAKLSHQAAWRKSVFEVYKDASLPLEWTSILRDESKKVGVDFLTSPYSFELVDAVEPFVDAFKVGSGDITWVQIIKYMARKGKPVLIAAGASTLGETANAVEIASSETNDLVLMQCNTNYTGNPDNYRHLNLNVLHSFKSTWPGLILGLSDHTQGIAPILGAVALGAKVIERHFTDDRSRIGPDHMFATDPKSWMEMVSRTRELELSLGSSYKSVSENEMDTVIQQRRAVRARYDLPIGHIIEMSDLVFLRPCPENAFSPTQASMLIGREIKKEICKGMNLTWNDLK